MLLCNLAKVVDKKVLTENEALNLDWKEKCRLVNSDPVTAARYFYNKFHQFFIKNNNYMENNPLGKVTDHFYKIEFQHRKSSCTYVTIL